MNFIFARKGSFLRKTIKEILSGGLNEPRKSKW